MVVVVIGYWCGGGILVVAGVVTTFVRVAVVIVVGVL